MENYKKHMKLNSKDAATEAGLVVGFNEKRFVGTETTSFKTKGTSPSECKGSMNDTAYNEGLNHKAAEWVHEHAFVKGQPNMTAQSFCDWTNNTLLLSSHLPPHSPHTVSLRTAVRWLHHLGFKPVSHKKRCLYRWR